MPRAVFTTTRGTRHQQDALAAAPQGLEIAMLREPGRAELVAALAGAAYLVSERTGVVDAALMDAGADLKLILRLGELCHDIDLEAARARGIAVCLREQEGVRRVAEFCVLQMLALLRRLRETEDLLRAAGEGWAARRRTDEDAFAYNWTRRTKLAGLGGRTVGILGFGEIGAALARRLRGWDVDLTYWRRSRLPAAVEDELGVRFAGSDELLAGSDVVVSLLPFTASTRDWLDARRIGALKPGALLVSSGSGGIVDEAALAEALAADRLGGAALDTFAVEPIEPGNPLLRLAAAGGNVLLTPHVAAGAPPDAAGELRRMWQPVVAHMAGGMPQGRIA